jgi:hypothetical protein
MTCPPKIALSHCHPDANLYGSLAIYPRFFFVSERAFFVSWLNLHHRSAPGGLQGYRHLAYRAVEEVISVDFFPPRRMCLGRDVVEVDILTVSGLSVGCTRLPSNRNRTELGALPCRSQNASISFFSAVVLLILKKTSLLLSVTLMFRCSLTAWASGFSGAGLPLSSDILT